MTNIPDNRNALPNGYRLGDYQIKKVLGDGAFGINNWGKQLGSE